ncbi:MAG: glucuronate isomerase [Clostridiales bacterium]|nr:glucuronate isomerase [Clostridiales bacterium]
MSVKTEILKTAKAERIFSGIEALPIIDYHCHLSPREIFEDAEFDGLSKLWLGADHYKWRLMRGFGIGEKYITGEASDGEKFAAFACAAERAYGNPLRDWARLELSKYFGIEKPLTVGNAEKIRAEADVAIRERRLSPRKLIEASNVEYIATTDDPADDLTFHLQLRGDKNFKTRVAPTFRADRAFNLSAPDFSAYTEKLSAACGGLSITGFADFLKALERRMADFAAAGCLFADIGIESFPDISDIPRGIYPEKTGINAAPNREFPSLDQSFGGAERAFSDARRGKCADGRTRSLYLGFIYPWWLAACARYGFTAQLHSGVLRNINAAAYLVSGADGGYDTVAESLPIRALIAVLNAAAGFGAAFGGYLSLPDGVVSSDAENAVANGMDAALNKIKNADGFFGQKEDVSGLPKVILYTLNPSYYYPLITLADSFSGIAVGAPWWFNDHRNGLYEYFAKIGELSHIEKIPGMLTDSRSFLSYARHDYFRMVLSDYLSRFSDREESLVATAEKIAYFNMKRVIKSR